MSEITVAIDRMVMGLRLSQGQAQRLRALVEAELVQAVERDMPVDGAKGDIENKQRIGLPDLARGHDERQLARKLAGRILQDLSSPT